MSAKKTKLVLHIIMALSLGAVFLAPVFVFAADCPKGAVCLDNPLTGKGAEGVPQLIGVMIKGVLGFVGAVALFMFIWGAFDWFYSFGSPEKVKKGTQTMLWAGLGILLVLMSYGFMKAITGLLGPGGE